MIYTYILAALMSTDPYPQFAFIGTYSTLEKCELAISKMPVIEEVKKQFGCLILADEAV